MSYAGSQERGLADPGRPLKEKYAAIAETCTFDERTGFGQLSVAINQRLRADAHGAACQSTAESLQRRRLATCRAGSDELSLL